MSAETHSFQAETQQLLDLMIHSLYSHKEVFLRELISNASDALDRLRFEALTDTSLQPAEALGITLVADPEARTLVVRDNGIGMTREEVVENIGTIARSGTAEFLKAQKEAAQDATVDLIGQFGVGFYASFMAAERVVLTTKRVGSDGPAWRWESAADGSYTLEEVEREQAGTEVMLYLKPVDADAGLSDFTDEWVLRDVVKRYSDFVAYPITLEIHRAEGEGDEAAAQPESPLNSMKAIWTRPDSDVTEDEYADFYRHISHDHREPLLRVATRIEGNFEARALLYVPSVAPHDLYHRERSHKGVQLYVKRVFIMDECRELLPEYLRFVRGVVDAEDVTLNVSREMLQQDPQLKAIRNHLVKKLLESLATLKKDDADKYLAFFSQFGPVLKEGLLSWEEKKDRILELVMASSTHEDGALTSLGDYVDRMGEEQEAIYYLAGPSRAALAGSPHLEAFAAKGVEVLLFTDPVDEVWLEQMPPEFRGKPFVSAAKGELELSSEEEKKESEEQVQATESAFKGLVERLRAAVQDDVKEVRLSRRLTESPACLVRDEGDLSPQIAEMLRQAGQEVPDVKPILELNPDHPLLERLKEIFEADGTDARIGEYAELLYAQARLAEGGALEDPAAFSRKVAELMVSALS